MPVLPICTVNALVTKEPNQVRGWSAKPDVVEKRASRRIQTGTGRSDSALPPSRLLGSQRFYLSGNGVNQACGLFPVCHPSRQAHFRMFSSRKANTSGSPNVHAEMEEVVPIVHRVAELRTDPPVDLRNLAACIARKPQALIKSTFSSSAF